MAAQRLLVVLDPHGGGLGGTQGVDAQQVGQGAMGTVIVWATWRNRMSSSRSSPWVRDSSAWILGSRA